MVLVIEPGSCVCKQGSYLLNYISGPSILLSKNTGQLSGQGTCFAYVNPSIILGPVLLLTVYITPFSKGGVLLLGTIRVIISWCWWGSCRARV